jgi:hypothetical protein
MRHHESPRPNGRGLTRRCYLDPLHGPQELVLNCRPGDRVQINDSVEVIVLDVRAGQVVLGIEQESDVVQPFDEE